MDLKESLIINELCLPQHGSGEASILYSASSSRFERASLSVSCVPHQYQVVCNHFLHTFCSDSLPRNKYVVFVLDTKLGGIFP